MAAGEFELGLPGCSGQKFMLPDMKGVWGEAGQAGNAGGCGGAAGAGGGTRAGAGKSGVDQLAWR